MFNLAKENISDDPLQGQMFNTSRLVQRVAELEDLVQEFKNQSAPADILDLKDTIARQSNQIADLKAKLGETTIKRYQAVDLFEKNELYQTYTKLVEERDDIIKQLVNRLQQAQQSQILSGNKSTSTIHARQHSAFVNEDQMPVKPNQSHQKIIENGIDDVSVMHLENEATRMNSAMARIRDQTHH